MEKYIMTQSNQTSNKSSHLDQDQILTNQNLSNSAAYHSSPVYQGDFLLYF